MERCVEEFVNPSKVLIESHDPSQNMNETPTHQDLNEGVPAELNSHGEDLENVENVDIQSSGKHWCIICKQLKTQIARHLQTHAEAPEIQALASLSTNEKRKALTLLRKKGDFVHTSSHPQEPIKVVRTSKKIVSADDAKGCPHCLGLYSKQNLYKHIQRCAASSEKHIKYQHTKAIDISLAQEIHSENAAPIFMEVIAPRMIKDSVGKQVLADPLIKLYGEKLISKHRDQKHLVTYVSTKTRELGRLVIEASKLDDSIKSLQDVLVPEKWDIFIKATQITAGFSVENNSFNTPSLALKISYSVKHVVGYVLIECIKHKNLDLEENMKRFSALLEKDFPEQVSSKALKTLYNNKFNKPTAIPLAEDVQKLYGYLKTQIKASMVKLEEDPTSAVLFDGLCKLVAVYLLVYNRRRPGELGRLPLASFNLRRRGIQNDEVSLSLSESERLLANSLSIVEMRGKKGRKVPLLINKLAEEALSLLLKCRKTFIMKENMYLLALPGTENPQNLVISLGMVTKDCGLAKPELITATNLRKHVATSCQILDLAENEMDLLAQFMGHDLTVHR